MKRPRCTCNDMLGHILREASVVAAAQPVMVEVHSGNVYGVAA